MGRSLHILGICGTFMAGLAVLARELGYRVTGQDANIYPPMSTQLQQAGIELIEGYRGADIPTDSELVLIGNALSRGNSAVEWVLNRRLPYRSGPEWLQQQLLGERWVVALSGTHGKTSTTAMVTTMLQQCGFEPGFLIGGVAPGLGLSARLGRPPYFVIEADEYDSAFFDKRSKFLHYRPQTLVVNNLEFDHGDIFADLTAIETQFHHLLRTVPGRGKIIYPAGVAAIERVLQRGCWSDTERLHHPDGWQVERQETPAGQQLQFWWQGERQGELLWSQAGAHSAANALAALAAVRHAGIPPPEAIAALSHYQGVKRRLETIWQRHGIVIYDDFAHHPTAIATTLAGVRQRYPKQRLIAVVEPRSNTMRLGGHRDSLPQALAVADVAFIYSGQLAWQLAAGESIAVNELSELVEQVADAAVAGGHIVVMSNGSFDGFHQRLITALEQRLG
ncbi:UDP-N-acetylmuramate:L-alanyl-gamma-D-glutamyl-meso-diaminopimelate ligase [Ectothiorhodospiraceae bacterium BW-2]|nr:UDP-N-acetylmuramate:L-alanyl-gamma-D-glutamyl-meso-diaminopimelate ligase [Ectothiorhodospiraceae bacterium BW-2]